MKRLKSRKSLQKNKPKKKPMQKVRAEEALRLQKAQLEMVTANVGDVIWMTDPTKLSMIFINPAYEKVWGRSCKSLFKAPRSFVDAIHPDDRGRVLAALAHQSTKTYNETYRISTPTGEEKWIQDRAFPIRNADGTIDRIVGIATDITQHVLSRNALRTEKERFEAIVNNIPVILGTFNKHGIVKIINKEWSKVLGWDLDSMSERDMFLELFPDPATRERVQNRFFGSQTVWSDDEFKTLNGRIATVSWTSVHMPAGEYMFIGRDISVQVNQQKIIEDQQMRMAESAKLSSLGEMAGGIAHEINNPLAIIIAKVAQLKKQIEQGQLVADKLLYDLDKIGKTSERIAKIVRGLRTFSRNGDKDPLVETLIGQVVEDTLEMCHERFRSNGIDMRITNMQDIRAFCRPVQLGQVLLNLLNNAFDAVVGTSQPWVALSTTLTSEVVEISITDSGNGIPQDVVKNMMNPFFSTKEVGRGTGLGLSISRGIIEDHGGKITYDSSSPNTRFVVQLPRKPVLKVISDVI